MTTKEFVRRSHYFESLCFAACLFKEFSPLTFIYRVSGVKSDGSKFDNFIRSLSSFNLYQLTPVSLYFDMYTLSQFRIDRKYFLAFVSRLSQYQKEVLFARSEFLDLYNCDL